MGLLRGFLNLYREEICLGLVHFAASCDQPFDVEIREIGSHGIYEIESWLVASGQYMGNAGTGNSYDVCKLGLTKIFGREKLL